MKEKFIKFLDKIIKIIKSDGIQYIRLDLISPNPYQTRHGFDEESLIELAKSIKEYGIIQPVMVRKISSGYELVAGERRLRAAKLAGLSSIPAIVRDFAEREILEIAFLENLQRKDLNVLEEAEAYQRICKEFEAITLEELAEKIGKSKFLVSEKLSFLKLPMIIKKAVTLGIISEKQAKCLEKLPAENLQIKALEKIHQNELSFSQTERLVEEMLIDFKEKGISEKASSQLCLEMIKNLVESMEEVGVDIEMKREEKEDSTQIKVIISKE